MSKCEFKQIAENIYKCKNCGGEIESNHGPELFSIECPYILEQKITPRQNSGQGFPGGGQGFPGDGEQPSVGSRRPSFFQMTKNAGASMMNHAMNSFQSVPANVKEERISICEGCEHYNSETTRCDECGCFINIKADWASEKCPIDKWDMWTDGPSGGCGGCGKN